MTNIRRTTKKIGGVSLKTMDSHNPTVLRR
jgi:hypothetical protein